METPRNILNEELKKLSEQESSSNLFQDTKIENVELPLKNETANLRFKEKVKEEALEEEEEIKLKELDGFDGMSFIKTEKNEPSSLCDYKSSDIKGEYLSVMLEPKVEPLDHVDSKMPVNSEEEEKYSNWIESSCDFSSSNNFNSLKELQKFPVENVTEGFESSRDNVSELFKDSQIEISKTEHGLKKETRDFNISEDNIDGLNWDKIVSNKRGMVNLNPEVKKMRKKRKSSTNINTEKKFQCHKCDYKTINNNRLQMHMQRHTSIVPHSCQICSMKFRKKQNLDYHIVSKHSKNEKAMVNVSGTVHSCEICDYKTTSISYIKTHLQTHKGPEADKKFQCPQCDFKTIHKYNLKTHIQTHDDPNSFPCAICNKKFYLKRDLDSHIVSKHSDSDKAMVGVTRKVHSCEICKYKTVYKRRLNDHIIYQHKSEDAEKKIQNYSCYMCNYKTSNRTDFVKHNQTHKVKKPKQCDSSEKKIKSKLFCGICNTRFCNRLQLDGHILTLHSENEEIMNSVSSEYYSCDFCDFKTVWLENIKRHQQTHCDKS